MTLEDYDKVVSAYQADKAKEGNKAESGTQPVQENIELAMTDKIYWVRRFYEDSSYFESESLTKEQAEIEVCILIDNNNV
jgi:hypothetical protein